MSGAVDLKECPGRKRKGRCKCEPLCICGWRKHMAAHGPKLNQPPGSEPWGHEFEPADKKAHAGR